MTPEYKTALIRGFITGLAGAGVQFCTMAPIVGPTIALYGAGVVFFGALAIRGGVEGTIDSRRAAAP